MRSLSGLLLAVKKRPPGLKQRASDAELFERRRPKVSVDPSAFQAARREEEARQGLLL